MDINDFHGLKEVITKSFSNKIHDERDNYILFSTKYSGENNKFLVTDLNNGLFSISSVFGFKVKTSKSFNFYDNGGTVYWNIQNFIRDSLKTCVSGASKQGAVDRETKKQLKIIFADLFPKLSGKYSIGYDGDFIRITDLETIEVEVYGRDGEIFVNFPMNKIIDYQQGHEEVFDASLPDHVVDYVLGVFTPHKTRDQFKSAVLYSVKQKLHSENYYENKETKRIIQAGLEYDGKLTISIVSNGKTDGYFVVKDLSEHNISYFLDAAIKITDTFKPSE